MNHLILGFLFVSTAAFSYGTATSEQVNKDGFALTVGGYHICSLDKVGVQCWGPGLFDRRQMMDVPELIHPTQASAGTDFVCALDQAGVKCWGGSLFSTQGSIGVPPLDHPTQIAAGENNACAIDNSGVKCWGHRQSEILSVPRLSHPVQIALGDRHACAIDDHGVRCWGENGAKQLDVPDLKHPKKIAAGAYHTCALDDDGVKCWGYQLYGYKKMPALKNPTQIAAGESHSCALDDDGVKCWGSEDGGRATVPANLVHPSQVSIGAHNTCAVDVNGINCWGPDRSTKTTPPPLANLLMLDKYYETIAAGVYRDKQRILVNLSKSIVLSSADHRDLEASRRQVSLRLFSMFVVKELLDEIHSEYIEKEVSPVLATHFANAPTRFGVSTITDIELNSGVLSVAFTLVESTLQAAKNAFVNDDRTELESFILEVATAKAQAANDIRQSARLLAQAFGEHQKLIETLVQTQATRGFGKVLVSIQHYLHVEIEK